MIVDEHLNDISYDVVKDLLKSRILSIVLGVFFAAMVFVSLSVSLKNSKLSNEIVALQEQVQKDEEIMNLEYSIGYWFIHKPGEVNDSTLYALLVENKAWYPDILVKQAKLESGNYSSVVFRNSNNLYGMKMVGKRNTTQVGNYSGYGVYNNWCLSALDRLLWDEFRFKGEKPTREEYYKAIDIYAEADSYQKLIDSVKLNIETND